MEHGSRRTFKLRTQRRRVFTVLSPVILNIKSVTTMLKGERCDLSTEALLFQVPATNTLDGMLLLQMNRKLKINSGHKLEMLNKTTRQLKQVEMISKNVLRKLSYLTH